VKKMDEENIEDLGMCSYDPLDKMGEFKAK
jgi:hypothetical protein